MIFLSADIIIILLSPYLRASPHLHELYSDALFQNNYNITYIDPCI